MLAPKDFRYSTLRRVIISNVIAYGITGTQGAIISGIPGHDIEEMTLNNMELPALIDSYPDPNRWGVTPAYAFFIRNVKDIKLNNRGSYLKDDLRPALILDNVDGADKKEL